MPDKERRRTMENKKYLLTVRFPFEAMDAVEARMLAKQMMQDLQLSEEEMKEVKLQEIFDGKPPQGVQL
jgi:hypothetical protein